LFAAKFRKGIQLEEAEVTSMDQQFLEKAIEVVEQNISDPKFSVETFCKEMAMSRVQLHRKLTALTNQSSSRFIRTIRLKRAAEYLAAKAANVTETAYQFGFNNLSYFTKCFQEEYGVKPSEFAATGSS
jgi:AraC-like DNA-binding protein